ncbi:MAG TPA: hypothetical protein VGL53_18375 [Bryobacteraceae bacterium]|jgi:hypothetical protein
MRPTVLLRVAAGLTFVHAVLHTIGGVFGKPAPGAESTVSVMKANQFPLMGSMRSYWDFYHGMGLAVSIFLLIEAIILWQLGTLAQTDAKRLRPILATFAAGYLALAVNSAAYFFPGPVIAEILIALCLILAIRASRA